ncbi:hypothetical protein BA022_00165 [Diaphorobacter nitroreducens]|nr:hypothetical protein BA022_00165 [Diaphorobacter nitroreducens]
MIDVPVFLNIGVANRLTVNLCNKRIDSANLVLPKVLIQIGGRPCVQLHFCVVTRGDKMNCGVVDLEEGQLFARIEATDTHDFRSEA